MSYALENIRLSHRQRSPPSYALSPPLLVRVSNWERSTPSFAKTASKAELPDLRSGWKFTVTRNVGSIGGPTACLAMAESALDSGDAGINVQSPSPYAEISLVDSRALKTKSWLMEADKSWRAFWAGAMRRCMFICAAFRSFNLSKFFSSLPWRILVISEPVAEFHWAAMALNRVSSCFTRSSADRSRSCRHSFAASASSTENI